VPAALNDRCRWSLAPDAPMYSLIRAAQSFSLEASPLPGWRPASEMALRVARVALGSAQVYMEMDRLAAAAGAGGGASLGNCASAAAGTTVVAAGGHAAGGLPSQAVASGAFAGTDAGTEMIESVLGPAEQGPQRLLPRHAVLPVVVEAMSAARQVQTQVAGAPGWGAVAADRWRLVVAAVDCCLRWPDDDPEAVVALGTLLTTPNAPSENVSAECVGKYLGLVQLTLHARCHGSSLRGPSLPGARGEKGRASLRVHSALWQRFGY
jgi:hypothetical protein